MPFARGQSLFNDVSRMRSLKVTSSKELVRVLLSSGDGALFGAVERAWAHADLHRDVRSAVLIGCLRVAVGTGHCAQRAWALLGNAALSTVDAMDRAVDSSVVGGSGSGSGSGSVGVGATALTRSGDDVQVAVDQRGPRPTLPGLVALLCGVPTGGDRHPSASPVPALLTSTSAHIAAVGAVTIPVGHRRRYIDSVLLPLLRRALVVPQALRTDGDVAGALALQLLALRHSVAWLHSCTDDHGLREALISTWRPLLSRCDTPMWAHAQPEVLFAIADTRSTVLACVNGVASDVEHSSGAAARACLLQSHLAYLDVLTGACTTPPSRAARAALLSALTAMVRDGALLADRDEAALVQRLQRVPALAPSTLLRRSRRLRAVRASTATRMALVYEALALSSSSSGIGDTVSLAVIVYQSHVHDSAGWLRLWTHCASMWSSLLSAAMASPSPSSSSSSSTAPPPALCCQLALALLPSVDRTWLWTWGGPAQLLRFLSSLSRSFRTPPPPVLALVDVLGDWYDSAAVLTRLLAACQGQRDDYHGVLLLRALPVASRSSQVTNKAITAVCHDLLHRCRSNSDALSVAVVGAAVGNAIADMTDRATPPRPEHVPAGDALVDDVVAAGVALVTGTLGSASALSLPPSPSSRTDRLFGVCADGGGESSATVASVAALRTLIARLPRVLTHPGFPLPLLHGALAALLADAVVCESECEALLSSLVDGIRAACISNEFVTVSPLTALSVIQTTRDRCAHVEVALARLGGDSGTLERLHALRRLFGLRVLIAVAPLFVQGVRSGDEGELPWSPLFTAELEVYCTDRDHRIRALALRV